jgi:hypothetical protein
VAVEVWSDGSRVARIAGEARSGPSLRLAYV